MRSLERQYRLMHRLGLTPWESAPPPPELHALTEGPCRLEPGTALDLGCGTGREAARLAALGWTVVAVDMSPVAIAGARRRSDAVRWQIADVRDLSSSPALRQVAGAVDLVVDLGCLHGLDGAARQGWAAAVALATAPRAVAVIRAAPPGRRLGLPRGISAAELAELLGPTWSRRSLRGQTHVMERHASPWPSPAL